MIPIHHDHNEPVVGCRCEERYGQQKPQERRASYLTPAQMFALDHACAPVREAFEESGFGPFLVGSVMQRADFRDVDVRFLLADPVYDEWPTPILTLVGFALSEYLSRRTQLNVDFQFQQFTAAQAFKGPRNSLGGRTFDDFQGDTP